MFNFLKTSVNINVFGTSKKSKIAFDEKCLDFCRSFTCLHQGALAEYTIISNAYHRELRVAIDQNDEHNCNLDNVRSCYFKLEEYMNEALREAWLESYDLIERFYEGDKRPSLPRICMKGSSVVNGEDCIIDMFRHNGKPASTDAPPVSSNTGFASCKEEGTYYRCNNIPAAARVNEYKNGRLNEQAAKNYKKPLLKSKKPDLKWANCWENPQLGNIDYLRSCYKSTLITPMTLKGNPLSKELLNTTNVEGIDRSVLGFFCMDHVNTGYFTERDINVSYIVADWISMYIILRHSLLDFSSSGKKAKEIIAA